MNTHILDSIIWAHSEPPKKIFDRIYDKNLWQSDESVSGKGSELSCARNILERLPFLLKKYGIKTIMDAPCGDYNWIKHLDYTFDKYTGIDIVESLINKNKKYENEKIKFFQGDILSSNFPPADLILCRDCFIHLTFEQIFKALENFKKSKSKMVMLTTYNIGQNRDVLTGQYRKINLLLPPFNFPEPLDCIRELPLEDGKYICLWKLEDL